MGTKGASPDAEALRRAWRGRSVLLGLVLLGALGAATYSWLRPRGAGAPESPTRVLVVGTGAVDHELLLAEAGFEAKEFTLAEWERRAASVGFEGRGLPLVLELADQLGYGYVAVEAPGRLPFEGLELAPDAPAVSEDTRYAVLSVGDLAFPHQLTVEGAPSEVVQMPGLGLLEALYRQPRLDPQREALTDRPTVDELNLQDRVAPGLATVHRVARLEATARQISSSIESRLIDTRAMPLARPLESGGAVPLPDGGVLSVVQEVRLRSSDGVLLEYVLDDALQLGWTPVDRGRPAGERLVCEGLSGGELPVSSYPELRPSDRGGTLLVRTAEEGTRVVQSVGSAEAPCAFEELGWIAEPRPGDSGLGVPNELGVVARSAAIDEGRRARVELHVPGDEPGPPELLGSLGGVVLGAPAWIDDDLLAVTGYGWDEEGREPDDGVYLFSRRHPGRALHLDGDALLGGGRIHQLTAVPGPSPALVLTVGRAPTRVLLLILPADLESMFEALEEGASEPQPGIGAAEGEDAGDAEGPPTDAEPSGERDEADTPAMVMFVAPDLVQVRLVLAEGDIFDPAVSPDGRWLAFGWDPPHPGSPVLGDPEVFARVAVMDLRRPDARPRQLTTGQLEDRKPRWVADGSALVFQSRVPVSVTESEISAPRLVPAEASSESLSSQP